MLCVLPALAENPDTGSWSQINQAVGKGEGWAKLETDDISSQRPCAALQSSKS